MTRNIYLLILFCVSIQLVGQDFIGEIKYKMSYEVKDQTLITVKQLESELGTKTTTYFYPGLYREISNASFMGLFLYRSPDTILYFKHHQRDDTLRTIPINIKPDQNLNYHIVENSDTILGYACDELIVETENGTTASYFYSNDLAMDPKYYENFTDRHKYEKIQIMKSVYLKYRSTSALFTVESEAIKIKQKKLSKRDFGILKHKVLVEGQ